MKTGYKRKMAFGFFNFGVIFLTNLKDSSRILVGTSHFPFFFIFCLFDGRRQKSNGKSDFGIE